jgi:hypothetical protein
MKDKRILYVSSEVVPYLAENEFQCLTMCRRWLMIKVGRLEFYAQIWEYK